jgi:putative ABC transport system ATP-binding protein
MTTKPNRTGGAQVTTEQLTKNYRLGPSQITAVHNVTLTIPAGQAVAVTGPSGSGKSTLLRLIGGIEKADAGQIVVDELTLTTARSRQLLSHRRNVGFVFQSFHLLPALTALDNVLIPVLPRRVPFNRTERARRLLADVGLEGRERALPSQLSGGQQQRVAIARALIGDPRLFLADEPTGNLDSATSADVMDLVMELRSQLGLTIVIATHENDVAQRCDRILTMRDGRIVEDNASSHLALNAIRHQEVLG